MDIKFDKEPSGEGVNAPADQEGKGRQTLMLVVLLVLLAGFGYVYFFTGIIRPKEQPPAPQPPPQAVKKPLPSRDAAPPKPADKQVAQAPKAAEPAAKPADKKPEEAKPAPAKSAVAPAAAKPEPPKPAQPQKAAHAPKPEPPKTAQPAKPPSADPAKPAPKVAAAKPEPAKAAVAVKVDEKPAEAATNKPRKTGPWTLVVGSYVVEETLATDMSRVKGAGLSPAITKGPKKTMTMHRLVYGDFQDAAAAQQAVDLLKNKSAGAFSIRKGAKHEVVAGSYSMLERATQEQQRLSSAGVEVKIQKINVAIPTRKLTAGIFTDRAAAESALKKLKKAAIGNPVLD